MDKNEIMRLRALFGADQHDADVDQTVQELVDGINATAAAIGAPWALRIEGDKVIMNPQLQKIIEENPGILDV